MLGGFSRIEFDDDGNETAAETRAGKLLLILPETE
jgi:hypothetical protein